MFKYNTLSDLKDSDELVTPLRKEEDRILCLNSNNEEVYYLFEDFDFDKTPGQREQDVVIEIVPEEPVIEEPEPEKIIIIEDTTIEQEIVVSTAFVKIKSNKKHKKDYFVTDDEEKKSILETAGYKYKRLKNVNIYVEEISV